MNLAQFTETDKGEHVEAMLSAPITGVLGERVRIRDGKAYKVNAEGFETTVREIGEAYTVPVVSFDGTWTVDRVRFFRTTGMQTPISTSLVDVSGPNSTGQYTFVDQNGNGTSRTLEECDTILDKYQANADVQMELLIANWRSQGGAENPDITNGTLVAINFSAESPLVLNRNV